MESLTYIKVVLIGTSHFLIPACQTLAMTFSHQLRTSLAATFAIGFCTFTAQAEDSVEQTAAKKAIAAQYAFTDRAIEKLDLESSFTVLASNFEAKGKDGTVMQRPEFEMQQRQIWSTPGLKIESSQTKIDKLEWFGAEAIVWSSSVVRMAIGGKSIQASGSSRDLWHPTDGQWLLKRSVELKTQTEVEGKAIPSN